MTGYTSWRLPVYAVLAAAGLVAGLALGRVEPVALAAPFLLALVAGVAAREPEVSVRLSFDRDRVIEGDEVTATVALSSERGVERLDLFVPLPPVLSAGGGQTQSVRLRAGEERTVELKLPCERWGVFSIGRVLFRARDTLGLRSWEGMAGAPRPLRVYPERGDAPHPRPAARDAGLRRQPGLEGARRGDRVRRPARVAAGRPAAPRQLARDRASPLPLGERAESRSGTPTSSSSSTASPRCAPRGGARTTAR